MLEGTMANERMECQNSLAIYIEKYKKYKKYRKRLLNVQRTY